MMRGVKLLVLAVLVVPAVPAVAQDMGTLTGTVYDSLTGSNLAGAHVWVRGLTRDAVTDRSGRFRIDSLPVGTPLIVGFEHADLDSVGLSANVTRLTLPASRALDVVLATRSIMTLRQAACGDRYTGPGGDSAMVFGSVRDAESGVRLSGAAVYAVWTIVGRGAGGGVGATPQTVVARTDSVGSYYACGVPNDVAFSLLARADTFASGAIEVRIGSRQLLRRDISISREALRPIAGGPRSTTSMVEPNAGVLRGLAVLTGVVNDERGQPRAGATVALDDATASAMTDERGRFVLSGLPSGSRMVTARIVGYSAGRQAVDLRNRDTTRVTFTLRAITVLDTISVVASARFVRLQEEIEQRRRVHSGSVLFEEEIRNRGNTRSLFFGMPNVITAGTHAVRYQLLFQKTGARWCSPSIFIDGIRATLPEFQAYQNNYLVAIEVYPRVTEMDRFSSPDGCGIILAWTKFLR